MSVRILTIKEDVLGANDEIAKANQERMDKQNILMMNIMSSPGAGKTSLIMQTVKEFKGKIRIAVIEGDIASTIDADKINEQDIPVIQINTAGGCHLDANMIKNGLDNLALEQTDLVIVENVGNLVCPASYDLGENIRCVLLSTPEGDDKPKKYPKAFTTSDCLIITKADLVPSVPFDFERAQKEALEINSKLVTFITSPLKGSGIDKVLDYFIDLLHRLRQ